MDDIVQYYTYWYAVKKEIQQNFSIIVIAKTENMN